MYGCRVKGGDGSTYNKSCLLCSGRRASVFFFGYVKIMPVQMFLLMKSQCWSLLYGSVLKMVFTLLGGKSNLGVQYYHNERELK